MKYIIINLSNFTAVSRDSQPPYETVRESIFFKIKFFKKHGRSKALVVVNGDLDVASMLRECPGVQRMYMAVDWNVTVSGKILYVYSRLRKALSCTVPQYAILYTLTTYYIIFLLKGIENVQ